MAKQCEICGRTSTKGIARSHSNVKTHRRQNINLQTKSIQGGKIKICTKCLKTVNKSL